MNGGLQETATYKRRDGMFHIQGNVSLESSGEWGREQAVGPPVIVAPISITNIEIPLLNYIFRRAINSWWRRHRLQSSNFVISQN